MSVASGGYGAAGDSSPQPVSTETTESPDERSQESGAIETAASDDQVTVTIDGVAVGVRQGSTILDACDAHGVDTPTICYAENLTPVNACRVCVVEVEGNRTLVPACSRPVEDAMVIATDSERVRHSRKMVLEFLGTANDLGEAPAIQAMSERYGADVTRYVADHARFDDDVKIQDDLYVRDYDKCVLCYKCVDACGEEAQFSFAIAMSGRGFANRISTEFDVTLPDSACVYCGNCIGVCPTNALQFKTEFDLREIGDWKPEEQTVTRTVCSYCGVGCNLELHVQDDEIVKVTSPADHSVTHGHLCVKGRFGWKYVHA